MKPKCEEIYDEINVCRSIWNKTKCIEEKSKNQKH
jgi:hypothetical protein